MDCSGASGWRARLRNKGMPRFREQTKFGEGFATRPARPPSRFRLAARAKNPSGRTPSPAPHRDRQPVGQRSCGAFPTTVVPGGRAPGYFESVRIPSQQCIENLSQIDGLHEVSSDHERDGGEHFLLLNGSAPRDRNVVSRRRVLSGLLPPVPGPYMANLPEACSFPESCPPTYNTNRKPTLARREWVGLRPPIAP